MSLVVQVFGRRNDDALQSLRRPVAEGSSFSSIAGSRRSFLKRWYVGIGPAFAAIGVGNRVDGEGDRRSRRNCVRSSGR
jgi:hypothetical protein